MRDMAQPTENHPATSADEPLGLDPSPDLIAPPAVHERVTVPHTRTSAAWLGIWAGAAALILLIIFVAQNTASVEVNFLWMKGHFSLAVALLVAGVAGALIAMAVAGARIIQLRRLVRRGH
jgi:uncharacterized integral membrane protein